MPTTYEIIMHILGLLIGWSLTSMYYLKKYELLKRRYDHLEKLWYLLIEEHKKVLKVLNEKR